MFKLVVLSALVALAIAKPSGVWVENPLVNTYSTNLVAAVPSAVSHSYRKDVISEPAVVSYSAPVVQKYVATAPVVQNYVSPPIAVPTALSHSYRSDIVSQPIVAAPIVQKLVAAPIVSQIAVPSAVSHSYRSDIVNKPQTVVAAYAAPWSYAHGW